MLKKPSLPAFEDLESAIHHAAGAISPQSNTTRIGVAFSGGLDSSALLVALSEWAETNGRPELFALHINHNIRESSELAIEASVLIALCVRFNVSLYIHTVSREEVVAAQEAKESLEAAARSWRYLAFARWIEVLSLDAVFLAHHADDQVEQRIARFLQGQNRDGGMTEIRGKYRRPFLNIERSRLIEFVSSRHIVWHEDSSNKSLQYLRNRVRHTIIPPIRSAFPGFEKALAQQSERFAEDQDFLEREAARFEWAARVLHAGTTEFSGKAADFAALHPALQIRTLKQACLALLRLGELLSVPSHQFFRFARDKMTRSVSSTKPKIVHQGENVQILMGSSAIIVRRRIVESLNFGYLMVLTKPGAYCLKSLGTVFVRPGAVNEPGFELPVLIRSLRIGELAPGGNKSLRNFLRDEGIPAEAVNLAPLVEYQGSVRAVLSEKWVGKNLHFEKQTPDLCCKEALYTIEIKELEFSL